MTINWMEEEPADLGETTITLYHPSVFLRAVRNEREQIQNEIQERKVAAEKTGIAVQEEKELILLEMDYRELLRIEEILEAKGMRECQNNSR